MKKCGYNLVVLALTMAIMAVAANGNFVSADACLAQLGSPNMPASQYYYSNVAITVPVSATCSFVSNELYAVGTAYDMSYNSNVGTANIALNPVGASVFSGSLVFNLPSSVQGHTLQVSVSIYSGQYGYYNNAPYGQYNGGPLLTTAVESFQVSSYSNSPYYNYPTYPISPAYPTYPAYPIFPTRSTYPTYPSNNYNEVQNYYNYYGHNYYGSCRFHFSFGSRHYCMYR